MTEKCRKRQYELAIRSDVKGWQYPVFLKNALINIWILKSEKLWRSSWAVFIRIVVRMSFDLAVPKEILPRAPEATHIRMCTAALSGWRVGPVPRGWTLRTVKCIAVSASKRPAWKMCIWSLTIPPWTRPVVWKCAYAHCDPTSYKKHSECAYVHTQKNVWKAVHQIWWRGH